MKLTLSFLLCMYKKIYLKNHKTINEFEKIKPTVYNFKLCVCVCVCVYLSLSYHDFHFERSYNMAPVPKMQASSWHNVY